MIDNNHRKVAIIGSGPAGLSAALYTARADLKPILFSGMLLHGQVSQTHLIENYPGFPDGISGMDLGQLFQKQAERFGAVVEFDQVEKVNLDVNPFKISTYSQDYFADAVIISTGADPKKLNIPGEKEFTGRGVSYCATCDGWFYKDKDVVLVGGGDSALEEGLFLTRFVKSVSIIHRRDKLRAGAILENRAKSNPKIQFIWNSIVTEIKGEESVSSVTIKNVISEEETSKNTEGIFIFIGHRPNSMMFKGQLEIDDLGYIKIDQKMQTSIPGVFAAGEIADPIYRQVVTSAGMGAAAGMQAIHYLESIQ